MRVNQVLLVPVISPTGGEGLMYGRYSEAEAVNGYIESILEHLEEDRVTASTHSKLDPIMPNSLVMYCGLGWDKPSSKAKCNIATVEFVGQAALPLASLLCESLVDWGKSYVDYHHKTSNPKVAVEPFHEGSITIVFKPFKLNGPNIDSYMSCLDKLGRTVAYSIYEFLLMRDEVPSVMKVDR